MNRGISSLRNHHCEGQIENKPMDSSYFRRCVVLLVQTFWLCDDIFLFLVVERFLNNESGMYFFTRPSLRNPTNERLDGKSCFSPMGFYFLGLFFKKLLLLTFSIFV